MAAQRDEARAPIPARPEGPPRLAWHHASADEVTAYWESDQKLGLSESQAKERLAKIGLNKLPEEPPEPFYKKLYEQVSDFTVLALLAAAAVAAGLGLFAPLPNATFLERFGDSIAILAIVVLNAVLGIAQGRRAE